MFASHALSFSPEILISWTGLADLPSPCRHLLRKWRISDFKSQISQSGGGKSPQPRPSGFPRVKRKGATGPMRHGLAPLRLHLRSLATPHPFQSGSLRMPTSNPPVHGTVVRWCGGEVVMGRVQTNRTVTNQTIPLRHLCVPLWLGVKHASSHWPCQSNNSLRLRDLCASA